MFFFFFFSYKGPPAVEGRVYRASFGNDGMPVMSAHSLQVKAAEKELDKLRRQYYWLRVSRLKLLMDLIFVCEDNSI